MRRIALLFACMTTISVAASGVYNVRDYGAKGDGQTLDSPAINAAIEAVNGRGADGTDGKALILRTLTDLQKKASRAKSSDKATEAHWLDLARTIEKALK